jgi:hypothetical protein
MVISLNFLMTKIILFNISVLCTYKYFAALLLQILRCAAPTNISQLCCYKYYGALHLQIFRSSAATNITVRCTYKYFAALLLLQIIVNLYFTGASGHEIIRCGAPKYL